MFKVLYRCNRTIERHTNSPLADPTRLCLDWKEQLRPKHPMAEAVNYTLSQWVELTVFTSDGAVPIDNNVSEREMKRVVLNRNYVQFRIMLSAAVKSAIVSLFVGRSGLTALMN